MQISRDLQAGISLIPEGNFGICTQALEIKGVQEICAIKGKLLIWKIRGNPEKSQKTFKKATTRWKKPVVLKFYGTPPENLHEKLIYSASPPPCVPFNVPATIFFRDRREGRFKMEELNRKRFFSSSSTNGMFLD